MHKDKEFMALNTAFLGPYPSPNYYPRFFLQLSKGKTDQPHSQTLAVFSCQIPGGLAQLDGPQY